MRWLVLLVLVSTSAFGQVIDNKIVVEYTDFPPMVYNDGGVKGFDIDLFNLICKDQGWNPYYVKVEDKQKRFDGVISGNADVLIGGVSITDDRERIVDFTTPYMNSGIQIVSRMNKTTFLDNVLNNKAIGISFIMLIGTLLGFGHIIWWCEQGTGHDSKDIGGHIDDNYFPGIFDAMWYCWMVITTIGEGSITAHKWKGRAFAFGMSIIGFSVAGNLLTEINTFKADKDKAEFTSIDDLNNMMVGIVGRTTSEDLTEFMGASFIPYISCGYLKGALLSGEVDAIAHDYPYILSITKGNNDFGLVGDLLYEQDYGFVITQQSPLREKMNISILKLMETGKLNSLKVKWFGTK